MFKEVKNPPSIVHLVFTLKNWVFVAAFVMLVPILYFNLKTPGNSNNFSNYINILKQK